MRPQDALVYTRKVANDQGEAVVVIIKETVYFISKHKKAAIIVGLFEPWVHSLMFQHLAELKSVWDAIPFIH